MREVAKRRKVLLRAPVSPNPCIEHVSNDFAVFPRPKRARSEAGKRTTTMVSYARSRNISIWQQ